MQALQQAGAGWHGNVNVLAVERSGGGLAVVLDDGRRLAGDLVLSAIGLRPQTTHWQPVPACRATTAS